MSEQGSQTNSPTRLFSRTRNKIRPLSSATSESLHVEIRPNRVLRIQHINARPRDPKFEKEMQMQYQKHVITATGGPLSMPKKKSAPNTLITMNNQGSDSLPNSINNSDNNSLREISASGAKTHFISPSNVHFDVEKLLSQVASGSSHGHCNIAIGEENSSSLKSNSSAVASVKQSNSLVIDHEGNTSESGVNSSKMDESEKLPGSHHDNLALCETAFQRSQTHQTEPTEHNTSIAAAASETVFQTLRHHEAAKETYSSVSVPNDSVIPRQLSTVLFFFHGVGGSSDVWQAQIKYFAKAGYEIVAPDLIGHGLSCTPKDAKAYHFNEVVTDIENIFDKFCKRRNILIGHSYGCSFAVVLARRRSRRVQKLVLISGGAPTPLAPQPGIFSLPQCMLGCVRPCLNCEFHRSAFHKTSAVIEKEEAFSIPTYVLQHTMNGQVWPDGDEIYHQWLLCSTLLIYGAQDKLVTLEEEKHMEEVIHRCRLEVIPDTSHMVMVEAPEEVNSLLSSFFLEDSSQASKNSSPQPPAQVPPPPTDRPVSRVSQKSAKTHKAMPSYLM